MSTGETWTLGHRPALDGLRGVAVLLVVVAHTGLLPLRAAGVVGVTMFFALSGFLITALLLAEHDRAGRINLGAFFLRRARRLLPALLAMLAVVGGGLAALGYGWGWLVREAAPAVFYYGNWQRATGDYLGFWSHTWSLAVEEQFYLVWPLVVIWCAARGGRRAVVGVAVAGVLYAITARLVLWDGGAGVDRVYYGSDTHMDALLVGALLAAVMHGRRDGVSRPGGWVAVLVAAMVVAGLAQSEYATFVAAVTVVPLLMAGALWFVARGDGAAWLEWSPLTLVGRRSYALYLWHYPIFALLGDRLPGPGWLVMAGLVGLSWLVTLGSWRYVEAPFLRRPGHVRVAPVRVQAPMPAL